MQRQRRVHVLQIALNVGAMLLAFVALIAVVNGILGGIGGWFGFKHITLESILGYVFSPIAFVIGVPWHEALGAGSYIGQKLVLNEFVAYSNFGPHIADFSKNVYDYQLCAVRICQFLFDCDYARHTGRIYKPPFGHCAPRIKSGYCGNTRKPSQRGDCRHVYLVTIKAPCICRELLCMKTGIFVLCPSRRAFILSKRKSWIPI